MMRNFIHSLLITAFSLTLSFGLITPIAHATSIYELPTPSESNPAYVVDQAEVISRINETQIRNSLGELAQKTGDQVRMVVIRRTSMGYTIEEFTEKLFTKWFPTPEEQANQVLLVIDTATNNSAIKTGSGVIDTLTETIATSIADETVQAPLRKGNRYNQALSDAGDRLYAVLSGQEDPGPPEMLEAIDIERTYATAEETNDQNATIWVVVLLVVATVVPMLTYFFYVGFPGS